MRRIAGTLIAAAALVAAASMYGCGSAPEPGVSAADATSISLTDHAVDVLQIPDNARPKGKDTPPEWISLDGHWDYAGKTGKGMHKWSTAIPIRPRGLFFHNAQPGMKLIDSDGRELVYDRFGRSELPFWSHNKTKIIVYFPDKGEAPQAGRFKFTYPKANEREKRLNFAMSGLSSQEEFIRSEVTDEWETRNGLLLPAPSTISWKVTVPKEGQFFFVPGLAEPEVKDGQPSDGVEMVVDVDGTEVYRRTLEINDYPTQSVDLSKWSDQSVTLTVRMLPGETERFDYAFLGQPILASRSSNPRRVVMIFVDTLRPDHMSLYGYERDTTKEIDKFAKGAVVFENARSIAPWTLPSTRSVITGMQPEYYAGAETLPRLLAKEGYSTAMFAGNVYLSSNFEMARDWGLHTVGMWPKAEEVTDAALEWLDERRGHDALLMVHYMDPHLPYVEPKSYRFLYAGESQGGLREEFHLSDVRKTNTRPPEVRKYIKDRYDNNIRYATDQIARILARVDDDDIVVFFADHGEEFWDHDGFEHGHSLYDELLHVPLAIKGPGITSGRSDAPVSLIDLTPTVLDMLDLPLNGLHGKSLVGVMSEDPAVLAAMKSRDLAFGRPLYGTSRWGVLHGGEKWSTHEDREELFDLDADSPEQKNVLRGQRGAKGEVYRDYFGQALGEDTGEGYRIFGSPHNKGRPADDMIAILKVPGGVKASFVEPDPLNKSKASQYLLKGEPGDDADYVVAIWHKGYRGQAVIWAIPNKPMEEVTHTLELCGEMGGVPQEEKVDGKAPAGLGGRRAQLARLQFDRRSVTLTGGFTPIFDPSLEAVSGSDSEMQEMLKGIGYVTGPEDAEDAPEETSSAAMQLTIKEMMERCFVDEDEGVMP